MFVIERAQKKEKKIKVFSTLRADLRFSAGLGLNAKDGPEREKPIEKKKKRNFSPLHLGEVRAESGMNKLRALPLQTMDNSSRQEHKDSKTKDREKMEIWEVKMEKMFLG